MTPAAARVVTSAITLGLEAFSASRQLLHTFSRASIAPSAAMCSATFSPLLYSCIVGIFCDGTDVMSGLGTATMSKLFELPASYQQDSAHDQCSCQVVAKIVTWRLAWAWSLLTFMPAPYTTVDGTALTSTNRTGSLH